MFYKLYYGFIKTSFINKIFTIIAFGILLVFSTAPLIGLDEAYRSFAEFSSIPDKENLTFGTAVVALALSLSGFFVFSLVIAIFLQWREQSASDIYNGKIIYGKSNHILILNTSDSIWYTLEGLNKRYSTKKKKNILIVIHNDDKSNENVVFVRNGLIRYKFYNLDIDIKVSDFYKVSTYLESNAQKASSTIVLSANNNALTPLQSDNFQLLITNMLCTINEYKNMLDKNLKRNTPHKAIAQYLDTPCFLPSSENIQDDKHNQSHFKYFNSPSFNRKLLSVSMIDSDYLQLFNKIIVDYIYKIVFVKAGEFDVINKRFPEVYYGFRKGILIGLTESEDEQIRVLINPFKNTISEDNYLIFLCKKEEDLGYESITQDKTISENRKLSKNMFQEMKKINLLVIGDAKPLGFIDDYLDDYSKAHKQYLEFDCEFENIVNKQSVLQEYDTVILNIPDDSIYRYFVMMINNGVDAHNLIVNINNEDIYWSLQKYGLSINQKLNIVFQKMYTGYLMEHFSYQEPYFDVYDELLSPRGSEFYFVNNIETYSQYSLDELKATFMEINSILVGFLLKNNDIKLLCDVEYEPSMIKKLIVISKGGI